MTDANKEKIDMIIEVLQGIQDELKQNDDKMKTLFKNSHKELSSRLSQDMLTQSVQLGTTIGKQLSEHTTQIQGIITKTDDKIQK